MIIGRLKKVCFLISTIYFVSAAGISGFIFLVLVVETIEALVTKKTMAFVSIAHLPDAFHIIMYLLLSGTAFYLSGWLLARYEK